MSSSRHRAEPAPRVLPRLPRHVPRAAVAAGAGAALLGGTLAVSFWPDAPPPTTSSPEAVAAAQALRAEAALRDDARVSRARTGTPAAPATSAPATRAAPATAAPKPTPPPVPKAVGLLWVTTDVNIRSGPSAQHERIGSYEALARAQITGVSKDGWIQVVKEGRAGWVRSTYLTRSKPKPPAEPAPQGVSDASCSISSDIEQHLSSNARSVYRAVCAAYGDTVSSFGGYRAGDDGDHGSGDAVDIMVSGDPGWDIARYVQTHAKELGVTYVIYQQKMWFAGHSFSDWEPMEDRGSKTANHYDHVHVSVS